MLKIDLKKATEIELKALGFDLQNQGASIGQSLQVVNKELQSRAIMNAQQKKNSPIVDEKALEPNPTAGTSEEYKGEVGKYKITGKAEFMDVNGKLGGELEIGSIQTLPKEIGDIFITKGVAEIALGDTE